MVELKWQDPPPALTGIGRSPFWDEIEAALRERPGSWALIAEGEDTAGWGRTPLLHRGLEQASRKRPDGKRDIYARAPEPVES